MISVFTFFILLMASTPRAYAQDLHCPRAFAMLPGAEEVAEFHYWSNHVPADWPKEKTSFAAFQAWKKSWKYVMSSGGIRMAFPDFQKSFAVLSDSAEAFAAKMEKYYQEKGYLYRGAMLSAKVSDSQMLSYFSDVQSNLLGMGVKGKNIARESAKTFEEFNRDLVQGVQPLKRKLQAHIEGEEGYWNSGLTSFSGSHMVADDFQKGAWISAAEKNKAVGGIIVEVKPRSVASIKTADETKALNPEGMSHEAETVLVYGVDPEAVLAVEVSEFKPVIKAKRDEDESIPLKEVKLSSIREAKRIGYNRVKITKKVPNEQGVHILVSEKEYELLPSGKFKAVAPQNP